jgi:spore coat protein B
MKMNNYNASMSRFLGKEVMVNRGGPESLKGKIIDVRSHYFVIQHNTNEYTYCANAHVKSITKSKEETEHNSNGLKYHPSQQTENVSTMWAPHTHCSQAFPNSHNAESFHALCRTLMHQRVKINRGGPESIDGIVSGTNERYVMITHKNEIVYCFYTHIKSISRLQAQEAHNEKSDGKYEDLDKKSDGKHKDSYKKSDEKHKDSDKKSEKKHQDSYKKSDGKCKDSDKKFEKKHQDSCNKSDGKCKDSDKESEKKHKDSHKKSEKKCKDSGKKSEKKHKDSYKKSSKKKD